VDMLEDSDAASPILYSLFGAIQIPILASSKRGRIRSVGIRFSWSFVGGLGLGFGLSFGLVSKSLVA
jgi:hypothetical protein